MNSTETSGYPETASSISTITKALQEALAPLLHPKIQHSATQFNSKDRPTLEIRGNKLIIHNIPSGLTVSEIDASFIGTCCHEIKHLYADGDRSGTKSIRAKLEKGQPLENNSIRMRLAYVYFLDRKSDKYQDVTIDFLLNCDERNPPKIFQEFNRNQISNKEINEFCYDGYNVNIDKDKVIISRKMTENECIIHMCNFIALCRDAIQEHLDLLNLCLAEKHECAATETYCLSTAQA